MALSALDDMDASDPLVEAIQNERSQTLRTMLDAKKRHRRKSRQWFDGYRAWVGGFRPHNGAAYYSFDTEMRAGFEQAMADHPDATTSQD